MSLWGSGGPLSQLPCYETSYEFGDSHIGFHCPHFQSAVKIWVEIKVQPHGLDGAMSGLRLNHCGPSNEIVPTH